MDPQTQIDQRAQQIHNRCIHFTGLQTRTCAAGVRYFTPGPQPCFLDHDTGLHVCRMRQFPSREAAQEQATREIAQDQAAVAAFNARHRARLCVDCGAPTGGLRQMGRCVYAIACGHRQFQGTLGTEG